MSLWSDPGGWRGLGPGWGVEGAGGQGEGGAGVQGVPCVRGCNSLHVQGLPNYPAQGERNISLQ
jgi:hypothetical protein